jgi:hypothetical protein
MIDVLPAPARRPTIQRPVSTGASPALWRTHIAASGERPIQARPWRVTDDELLEHACADGYDLEERACQDAWLWGWCRGDDRRLPCYLEQRQAINWMADRLRRERVFI